MSIGSVSPATVTAPPGFAAPGPAPADSSPAGSPPAGSPPAGSPPAGSAPAGSPAAGSAPAGSPAAGPDAAARGGESGAVAEAAVDRPRGGGEEPAHDPWVTLGTVVDIYL
ncbi:hypothetical protein EV385_0235 [Krasilnikovia cinnamomea]|uniref:Uncharacterized protein n=1 Tax=Krasilnikovia cinnamomea TaxID=349313 RepID=A0A4Q7ZD02_9ACTN|nr:hypothetical protein [Krasilnikovia cinnamomea]RZU48518.1 hypothetical protein EV385_0235 [Krasilnikovia cinnamomea]